MAVVTKPILLNETFAKEMGNLASVLTGMVKGALPIHNHDRANGVVEIAPNVTNVFPELDSALSISFSDAPAGLDCEWVFIIPMGENVYSVSLPNIEWYLGIAPAFSSNTITEIRVHRVGNIWRGVWTA